MIRRGPSRLSLALYLGAGILVGLAVGAAAFAGFPAREQAPSGPAPGPAGATADVAALMATGQSAAAPVVGARAPDFALVSLEGDSYHLTDLRGQAVALNFWATWCEPCEAEMPLFDAAREKYAEEGFVVLGIDADEPANLVADFRDRVGVGFPLLLDPGGEAQQLYRVRGYPTTFFIDREGVIQAQQVGILSNAQLERYLGSLGIGDS
jgi:peroxiredoxin